MIGPVIGTWLPIDASVIHANRISRKTQVSTLTSNTTSCKPMNKEEVQLLLLNNHMRMPSVKETLLPAIQLIFQVLIRILMKPLQDTSIRALVDSRPNGKSPKKSLLSKNRNSKRLTRNQPSKSRTGCSTIGQATDLLLLTDALALSANQTLRKLVFLCKLMMMSVSKIETVLNTT